MMTCIWFRITFVSILMYELCDASNRSQLFKDVLDVQEVRVAPFNNQSEAIDLSVALNLILINNLNEKDQTFEAAFWMSIVWNDSRLKWNSSHYQGIAAIQTTSKHVWIPSSICIYNDVSDKKCLTDEKPLSVLNTGYVVYTTSRESVTKCRIDITKYPYDSQVCSIEVGNLFDNYDFIHFDAAYSRCYLDYFQRNEQWDVTGSKVSLQKIKEGLSTGFQNLKFDIYLKRRPGYMILSVLLPVVLLSVLNIFCFVLPIDSGEKMGTSMAIFLTFAVFLTIINDTMPKSDNVPYFTFYLATQLVVSGVVVILEAIVLRISFTATDTKVRPLENREIKRHKSVRHIATKFLSQLTAPFLDKLFMIMIIIVNMFSLLVFFVKTS